MKTRNIKKAALKVTELGFGGASIGNLYRPINNQQSEQAIHAAWEAGVRYFDTAAQYGHGLSEHRLGYTLREYPREQFVLSTKVGKKLIAETGHVQKDEAWFIDPLPFRVEYDYRYDSIKRCIEDSLQRLGMNQIDIVHTHDLDHRSLGDAFESHFKDFIDSGYRALAEAKEQGLIKAISLGIKEHTVCEQAMQHGDFDCFMLQGNFTLLEQPAYPDFLDQCFKKDIAILQAGPFSSGILVKGAKLGAKHHHTDAEQHIIDQVKIIEAVCENYQVPMPAVAIQFPLTHPAIASIVVGLRSPEQIKQNQKWMNTPIPNELWQDLKSNGVIPK